MGSHFNDFLIQKRDSDFQQVVHAGSIHLQENHGQIAHKLVPTQPLRGPIRFQSRVSEKRKVCRPLWKIRKNALEPAFGLVSMLEPVNIPEASRPAQILMIRGTRK